MMRRAASAAPTDAGTAEAVNRKARDWTRRKSTTSCEPAMKPPQDASDFEKVPMRRSTWPSTPNSSAVPAPRAPSTPAPCASSTISRAPCARQRSTICVSGAGEHRLELVEPVVAEGPQLGAGEQAAVQDRRVVAGIGDDRVAGSQDG